MSLSGVLMQPQRTTKTHAMEESIRGSHVERIACRRAVNVGPEMIPSAMAAVEEWKRDSGSCMPAAWRGMGVWLGYKCCLRSVPGPVAGRGSWLLYTHGMNTVNRMNKV